LNNPSVDESSLNRSSLDRSNFISPAVINQLNHSNLEIAYHGEPSERIYSAFHRAVDPEGTSLIICPPFGQEMVTTYARLARLSKQLATEGVSVLRYHPFGTGESDGTHADITLESVVRDAVTAQGLVRERVAGGRIGYFGLRFGATVAILAASERPVDFLVLWCPMPNLRQYFRDLLRSQITADAVQRSRTRTTQEMMADLEAGKCVDVLGYELSPTLYRQMMAAQSFPDTLPARRILYLVRPAEEKSALPLVERWRRLGGQVNLQVIPETAFWENPGTTLPEKFAAVTMQWLSQ
jgi:uncharacterized protein